MFDTFQSFLSWLTGADGGAFILLSMAASWLLESTGWWNALTSKIRGLIILGIAIVLGIGALFLQNNPQLVAVIDPYFKVIMYSISAWLALQGSHRLDNLRKTSKSSTPYIPPAPAVSSRKNPTVK